MADLRNGYSPAAARSARIKDSLTLASRRKGRFTNWAVRHCSGYAKRALKVDYTKNGNPVSIQ
jgi:hypothetical protein